MSDFSWVPLASGLVGALVGASSNAYLQNIRERRTSRRELVGTIGTFTEECIAAIIELQAAILSGEKVERLKAVAEYQRIYANGLAIEIRIFQAFRRRKVRAGFNKVLTRLEAFMKLVSADETVSDQNFKLAELWTRDLLSTTISEAAREAAIDLIDPGGIYFIGFKRANREELQALSFVDEPPPWKSHIGIDVKDMSDKEKDECRTFHEKRIAKLVCKEHGRRAHVYLKGARSNFNVQISSCCEEFGNQVHDALGPDGRDRKK
jgi:hypothetical protein